jgi:hypothetical protein
MDNIIDLNIIYNYFIDNHIIIYKNDTTKIKIKKFLLKYKRIISLVLLIILIIIGYYCNPYNFEIYSNTQNGGGMMSTLKSKYKEGVKSQVAKFDTKVESAKEGLKSAGEGLATGAKAAVSPSTYYNAGATAARAFRDNADVIYQIFYAIALFIIICIVTLPAIAFAVVGICCYFLLKDKMKTFKSL